MDVPVIERRKITPMQGFSMERDANLEGGSVPPNEYSTRRKSDAYLYRWCQDLERRFTSDAEDRRRIERACQGRDDALHQRINRVEDWGIYILLGILLELIIMVGGFGVLFWQMLG